MYLGAGAECAMHHRLVKTAVYCTYVNGNTFREAKQRKMEEKRRKGAGRRPHICIEQSPSPDLQNRFFKQSQVADGFRQHTDFNHCV